MIKYLSSVAFSVALKEINFCAILFVKYFKYFTITIN